MQESNDARANAALLVTGTSFRLLPQRQNATASGRNNSICGTGFRSFYLSPAHCTALLASTTASPRDTSSVRRTGCVVTAGECSREASAVQSDMRHRVRQLHWGVRCNRVRWPASCVAIYGVATPVVAASAATERFLWVIGVNTKFTSAPSTTNAETISDI